ncbi:hypothetical protein Hanom_Chr14g01259271 [Helianthus anomalus]
MRAKDKFKDDGPPAGAYIEKRFVQEGALLIAGVSLLWRNSQLYPAFQRVDGGEWSLFDFVDPPRNAVLRSADHVVGE